LKDRRELWALACALGPRSANQLRLIARAMARRPRRAQPAEPPQVRRWWHFAAGVEPASAFPAVVGGLPGVILLGATSSP
jgi:hypothetical protein